MRRRLSILAAAWAVAAIAAAPTTAVAQVNTDQPIEAVLELFTSQGCSSCPAADALFETYTQRPGILALSFPIDIWDKLGWKDTLANPKFSKRQKAYAKMRHDGRIYTPQLVINAGAHVVGSNSAAIETELAKSLASSKPIWVPVVARREADTIVVDVSEQAHHAVAEATLWLVNFDHRITVEISRGENAGKSITYSNVVRDIAPVGVWTGTKTTLRLPISAAGDGKTSSGAVILQRGGSGRIIGATVLAGR
ncbi:MAG TPA: DUF1223 domain-containing protein [Hyphomicrobiaceae bacterium]|nr:DUF1223 domain-containing protein [Hyphomicrobiaceae bacterium]